MRGGPEAPLTEVRWKFVRRKSPRIFCLDALGFFELDVTATGSLAGGGTIQTVFSLLDDGQVNPVLFGSGWEAFGSVSFEMMGSGTLQFEFDNIQLATSAFAPPLVPALEPRFL